MAFTDDQLRERMEPEVAGLPVVLAPEISIAISMKRIADAICGGSASAGIADSISQAISEGIFNAARK